MLPIIREVGSVASFAMLQTFKYEMCVFADGDLKRITDAYRKIFKPYPNATQLALSPVRRAFSVIGTLPALFLYSIQLAKFTYSPFLVLQMCKISIKKCSNTKLALIAFTCLGIYSQIKHQLLDESRVSWCVEKATKSVGIGALLGMLHNVHPVLGFLSLFPLHVVEFLQRQKVSEEETMEIIEGKYDESNVNERITYLRERIDRYLPEEGKDEGMGFEEEFEGTDKLPHLACLSPDAVTMNTEEFTALRAQLSKEDFSRLLPNRTVNEWKELTRDEKINMAFLAIGMRILSSDPKDLEKCWLERFQKLLPQQEGSVLEDRQQFVIDHISRRRR